jgi:hypothetical protein
MKSRRLLGVALVEALLAPFSATAAGADGPGRNATPSATTFTRAQVTINGVTTGLSSLAPTALQMVNGSTPLATPGPVSSTNSFSVV